MAMRAKKAPSDRDNRTSIGLSAISNQVMRKVVKKGFDFCLMVVGESGLGKSTLVNTLFMGTESLSKESTRLAAEQRIEKTIRITKRTVDMTEKGVHVKLTIVDTPGFSDAVNNDQCWQPIVDYIDSAFRTFLQGESQIDRAAMVDDRVHCCLYFIDPSAHGLKPVDVRALTALHHKVNIIPVVAKADTLTRSELSSLKDKLRADFERHDIHVFSPALDEEDETVYTEHLDLVSTMPFAVVGCNKIVEVGGRSLRGRVYPWGVVEVDNKEHCDFEKLRNMLIRTHTQDMKDVTTENLYEAWRREALASNPTLVADIAKRRAEEGAGREREREREESEADLLRRHEQMRRDIEAQQRALEETKRQIEEERRKMESMRAQQSVPPSPHRSDAV